MTVKELKDLLAALPPEADNFKVLGNSYEEGYFDFRAGHLETLYWFEKWN